VVVPPQLLSVVQLLQALDGDPVTQYPELAEVVTMAAACGQHWLFESQVIFTTTPLLDDPTEVTLVALASVVHEQDVDGQKEGTLLQLLSHQASVPELAPIHVQTCVDLR